MIEFEDSVQCQVTSFNDSHAKFRFLWIVSDYLTLKDKIKRDECITQKVRVNVLPEKLSCKLEFYPNGSETSKRKHTSVFLTDVGVYSGAWACCKIAILDGRNDKRYTCGDDDTEVALFKNRSRGYNNWFPIEIPEEHALLFPNGCLQILVKGTAWAEEPVEKMKPPETLSRSITSEASLFESDEHSDAILSIGDEKFQVHKNIVSVKSPVFRKLFQESTQNIIVVPDINPCVFRVILYFIYNNMLTARAETMLPKILEIAHKYELCHLKEISEIKLASCISEENCIEYLLVADKCEAIELKERVLKFISEKKKVKNSQADLMNLPHELLVEAFSRFVTLE